MTEVENLAWVSGSLGLENGISNEETECNHADEVEEVSKFYESLREVHKSRHDADGGEKFSGEGEKAYSAVGEKVLYRIEPDNAEQETYRDRDGNADNLTTSDCRYSYGDRNKGAAHEEASQVPGDDGSVMFF